MSIRLIGKKSHFTGNILFDILNNLKNYGVGRVVCQNSKKKYSEMCYYVIKKVTPMRETIGPGPDELVYGKVWAEEVFRGKKMEGLTLLTGETCMPDWYLIPKEDEDKYLKYEFKEVVKLLPKYDSIPPVLAEIMKQKDPEIKDPKMERVYNDLSVHLSYKISDTVTPEKVCLPDAFKTGIKY